MHVTHDVLADPGLDALEEILVVQVAVDRVALARRRFDRGAPAQDGVALAFDVAPARGRIVRGGAIQEPPRRDVELERRTPGLREICLLRGDLLEERSGRHRCRAASADVVRASRVARRGRREIDHTHVARDRPHRVVRALADHRGSVRSALLERDVLRRSRVRNGFRIAQRFLRVCDRRFCILRHRVPAEVRRADSRQSQLLYHRYSPSSSYTKIRRRFYMCCGQPADLACLPRRQSCPPSDFR